MVVDEEVAVSTFKDPDLGAIPLSPSTSPPDAPKSKVSQLFDLIMAKITLMEVELKRIGDKVDGRAISRSVTLPKPAPKAAVEAPPDIPSPWSSLAPTQDSPPIQRIDDIEEAEVDLILSDDQDFPTLAPMPVAKNRRACGWAARVIMVQTNAAVPGAPAPDVLQAGPGPSRVRARPIFASVVTAKALGGQAANQNKAQQARAIQS
jgi:hypothetical protein